MSRISLEAVPGRVLPVPGRPGHFYGLRRARAEEADSAIVHRVPDGHAYVSAGPFAVDVRGDAMPRDQYLRRAVQRGDLRVATADASKARPAPVKE